MISNITKFEKKKKILQGQHKYVHYTYMDEGGFTESGVYL